MGQRRLDTLGDISRHGLRLLFRCSCGRETRYEPMDVAKMTGNSGRELADIRGRCTACGRCGVRPVIDPHSIAQAPLAPNVTPLRPKSRTQNR